MRYVYRYQQSPDRALWKWQVAGTLVWTAAASEAEAISQMKADAERQGRVAVIKDISIYRPPKNPDSSAC